MNLDEIYRSNPDLRDYYVSLPGSVRMQILEADMSITTLGELQKMAEGLMHNM